MIFHFLVTVWGDEFVDLFLNLCLPNQLTPGNLLAFRSDEVKATYIIYTTARDQETIERHESYQRPVGGDAGRDSCCRFPLLEH